MKRAAGTEYRMVNNSQEHKGIDIRDMHKWSLYNPNYKFLPKLKRNSTVSGSSPLPLSTSLSLSLSVSLLHESL